jgi:hypothetical protein
VIIAVEIYDFYIVGCISFEFTVKNEVSDRVANLFARNIEQSGGPLRQHFLGHKSTAVYCPVSEYMPDPALDTVRAVMRKTELFGDEIGLRKSHPADIFDQHERIVPYDLDRFAPVQLVYPDRIGHLYAHFAKFYRGVRKIARLEK